MLFTLFELLFPLLSEIKAVDMEFSQLSLPLILLFSSFLLHLLLFIAFPEVSLLSSSSLSYLFFAELKTNCCFPNIIGSFWLKAF